MQELVYAALVPHPPIIVPAIGGPELARAGATRTAMAALAAEVVAAAPDTIVIISPHGPVFRDAIAIHMLTDIGGDFGDFGAPDVSFAVPVDQDLGALVIDAARQAGIPMAPVTPDLAKEYRADRLDHGTMVPLYYLREAGWHGPILPIAMGILRPLELYRFGESLQRAIDQSGRRIAVLASGDLSHRLTPDAPAGYNPLGKSFDQAVVDALTRGDLARLFALDHDRVEAAGECGLRPLMVLAGALDGLAIAPRVLSYEGPFGVGYAVVSMRAGHPEPSRRLRERLEQARQERVARRRANAHPLVVLARTALEQFVRTGLQLDFSSSAPDGGTAPWQLPQGLPEQAGVFVSLKVDGELRGCMGTTSPSEPTLALEVASNTVMAGTGDPRFDPVTEEELDGLDYSVDVLHPAEPCTRAQLDPKVFGVIVGKGRHHGLLLPDLAGVDTVAEQVAIACQKAGLRPDEPGVQLFRFRIDRFH